MSVDLSIVLPGYNECESLPAAVEAYRRACEAAGLREYELIIVDDGSTDGMGEVAAQLAAADPRIRVIAHAVNRGQVEAILTGFRAARGAVVTHNGIDLPFDPFDLPRVWQRFAEGADVVVVERRGRRAYGWGRKLLSWINIGLLRLLFRSPVVDHNFVQFFRREVLGSLAVRSRGVSTVTVELIVRAFAAGYRIDRVAADYHARRHGRGTVTPWKAAAALFETVRLWVWLMLERVQGSGFRV
ncbi:MAG TPA: glycosyltransferase family 2 protein, partial [Pirellulales bacterium]|nr:glycosyltransferase family 2 protein [Pirellulales bacterium]